METKIGKHFIDSALNIAKVTKNSSSMRNKEGCCIWKVEDYKYKQESNFSPAR